jgi:nicotinamide-nucleotide amidase
MLNKYLKVRELCCKVFGGYIVTKDLHTFGVPEIVAEDISKKCIQGNNSHVTVMTLVHDGIVTINIQVNEKTKEGALGLLNKVESGIRNELGDAVFGTCNETLENAVAELLRRYKKTIAVAESCTGGLVSDRLTNVSGISEFFLEGIVAYSNKSKVDLLGVPEELILRHGAVSPQVASAMAVGVRKRSSADIGVGITGIAGPTGATKEKPVGLVYIAVDANKVTEVREYRFKGSRIDIKKYSTNTALNMVRLKLMEANQ